LEPTDFVLYKLGDDSLGRLALGSQTLRKKLGTRRYRRVSLRLDHALWKKQFDDVGKYSAQIAAVASSSDTLAILTSAAQAYKEGKEENWTKSSSEIAGSGIVRAAEISKVKLTPQRKDLVKTALSEAVERVKSKHPS